MDRQEDMEMNEVSWTHKALIGAAGGLCLVLLKLIDASFYVGDISSKQAVVGYLTYLAYLIIGTIVAVFLSEHNVPKEKVIKSAFIAGLLGPSMLIALLKQPVVPTQPMKDVTPDIPKISDLLISPAHAQTKEVPAEPIPVVPVQVLKKDAFELSFKDAFLNAIGRPVIVKSHMYVIGVADSEAKATAAASEVNKLIPTQEQRLQVKVLKPEGKHKYYLIWGGLEVPSEAIQLKANAQATAIKTLKGNPDKGSKMAATLLLEGKVVKGEMLLK